MTEEQVNQLITELRRTNDLIEQLVALMTPKENVIDLTLGASNGHRLVGAMQSVPKPPPTWAVGKPISTDFDLRP
jgi:hypothetical protein